VSGLELAAACLALGATSGLLAGLLGIGGGVVIVPGLALVLTASDFPADRLMQCAVGTSLATIAVTAIASAAAHHRRRAVDWRRVRWLAPGVVVGAALGALAADALATDALATVFGVFLIAVAVRLAWPQQPGDRHWRPGPVGFAGWGTAIAGMASLLGIGGGMLTVPLLRACGVGIHRAVGTAAALGLPIAWAGAASFIVAGYGETAGVARTTGYVHWPAWALLAPAAVALAPVGARAAHALPTSWLQRIFAAFALIVGVRMLWG